MSNNNEKPLISVIVPVYNTSAYLARCIESLTSQTYRNLEIILVDDGSTDNSGNICDEYAAHDSRIKVIHKKNGGVCSARNYGLDAATGSIIGFTDSDDYMDKDMFKILQENMTGDMSVGNVCDIYDDGRKNLHNMPDKTSMPYEELLANFTSSGLWHVLYNKLYKKELIGDIRFRNISRAEDPDFIFRLIIQKPSVSVCSRAVYYYCIRNNSLLHERKLYRYVDSYFAWKDMYAAIKKIGKGLQYKGFFSLPFTNFAIFAAAAGNGKHLAEIKETSKLIRETEFLSSRHLSASKKIFAAAFAFCPGLAVSIMRFSPVNKMIRKMIKITDGKKARHFSDENTEKTAGIMTFHRADNYGALLQGYALKRVLKSLGANASIINYLCPEIEKTYSFFSQTENFGIKWLIRKAVKIFFIPAIMNIRRKFRGFRNEYLCDTEEYTPETIKNADFDIYISGSDQVFNPRITGFDKNYFLDFAKDKSRCFSYSASFGLEYAELTDREKEFFRDSLKNFSRISIREKEGLAIAEKTCPEKESLLCLDPSLLLGRQEWEELAEIPKEKDFVLLYLMNYDGKIINYAKALAKAKNLPLIMISHKLDLKKRPGIIKITPAPQQFLGYFLNAKYIVTNSFHGAALSVLFNKAFFTDMSESRKTNPRLMNFLELMGLKGRLIDNIGTNYDAPADWDAANAVLAEERAKSLAYLKEITK